MSFATFFSWVTAALIACAFVPYITAICSKTNPAMPRKATWAVWAVSDAIIFAGMWDKGTISGQISASVIGASLVFLLSLKFGEKGWKRRDIVCMTLSGAAIGLWMYFGESNVGIAFSLLALIIAAWPTWESAWKTPEQEDKKAWAFFGASCITALFAIPKLSFADVAPPVTFILIDGVVICLLFVRRPPNPWAVPKGSGVIDMFD